MSEELARADANLRAIARLETENAALRQALQRYVDSDGCEYADNPPTCPGDPPYVAECHWHQAQRALGVADTPAPCTLIAVEDLAAAELCDAAAARLRSGRQAGARVETVARAAIDAERESRERKG